jgi:Flp pilus assembly protein TadG
VREEDKEVMFIRRTRNDRGTTIVEFALVLPIFLLLVFGIFDFGRYFFVEHTLQYATREGMRLALVGAGGGTSEERAASIIATIKGHVSLAVDPSDPSLSIYIFQIGSDYSDPGNWQSFKNNPKPGDPGPNAGIPGSYMRVRTRYTYEFMTPLIGAFFTGGGGKILVEAQGTYRNELFD